MADLDPQEDPGRLLRPPPFAEVAYNGLIAHIEARLCEGLPISPSDVLWLINHLRDRDMQLAKLQCEIDDLKADLAELAIDTIHYDQLIQRFQARRRQQEREAARREETRT